MQHIMLLHYGFKTTLSRKILVMSLSLLLLVLGGATPALANSCSESVEYMCANVDECWAQVGFASAEELAISCLAREGAGSIGDQMVGVPAVITAPPRSITVPLLASAQFSCTADNAIKVVLVPENQLESSKADENSGAMGSTQKVIQEIDEVHEENEGWYVCMAWGNDGRFVSERAYLKIEDICESSDCIEPKVCKADRYTGEYECVCPGDCSQDYKPVCGSNCQSYFNACQMKKETCEAGLDGIYVKSKGFCPNDCKIDTVKEPKTQCCKVYGDPHVITFDQVKYDYMGSCDYILAQDAKYKMWSVYGKFAKCGDPSRQLSCIISIDVNYGGETIQFLRNWRVNYKGEEFVIPNGSSQQIGEMTISNTNMKYSVSLADTGIVVSWDGIITSEICLPKKCARGVEGMCANADCDETNEFDRRGFLNPYTQSWKAETSSEFGNSWAVDPIGCDFEPEEGSLSQGVSPCDLISPNLKRVYEERCRSILKSEFFMDCVDQTGIDSDAFIENCMFDSCSGLVFGLDCKNNDKTECKDEFENQMNMFIRQGYLPSDIDKMFSTKRLDPGCMMGLSLVRDCASWGMQVDGAWREETNCPSDEELENMTLCP